MCFGIFYVETYVVTTFYPGSYNSIILPPFTTVSKHNVFNMAGVLREKAKLAVTLTTI